MPSLAAALAAAAVLAPAITAQDTSSDHTYTVWSSVIFSRTGERTPSIFYNELPKLTSLGATQQFANGAYFRERYIGSSGSSDGNVSAPLAGLSVDELDDIQLYVLALDQAYNVASAQAFMQGFYPPYVGNETTEAVNSTGDVSSIAGYQYPQIHTADVLDYEYPFIGGQYNCPAWDAAAVSYLDSPEALQTESVSQSIYQEIGDTLSGESTGWSYRLAYAIYDWLSYQQKYNVSAGALLAASQYGNAAKNVSYVDMLRWYADEQQYAWLGNMNAENEVMGGDYPTTGSVSTIAGNMLATKMLSFLENNIFSQGYSYKLNLLFADYQPLTSFFALTDLPPLNSHFYGLPEFASVAALELFSYTTEDTAEEYPSEDDLWVRFLFRNGTSDDDEFLSYPLFNYGPSHTDMRWSEFRTEMYGIMLSGIGDWCTQCGSDVPVCAAWNSTVSEQLGGISSDYDDDDDDDDSRGGVSPAVGGVIGAVLTLVIAGAIFAAAMFFGGVRMHRVQKSHRGDLGGFKGGQKMRSDEDVSMPKGGAVVGATVERSGSSSNPSSPVTGHERVGSWELKGNEANLPNIAGANGDARRPSFEEDDVTANPFRDPVKADERV